MKAYRTSRGRWAHRIFHLGGGVDPPAVYSLCYCIKIIKNFSKNRAINIETIKNFSKNRAINIKIIKNFSKNRAINIIVKGAIHCQLN